jgi:uncharacterized protein
MARGPAPPTDADLLILDEFLLSDRSPEHAMCICELDGFLTGVIAGPEQMEPSEWMPAIWGGGDLIFDGMEETSAILGTIMRRYNEIQTNLETGPESFNPIFENARGGIKIVTDWAAGFIDAAKLRAEKWEALNTRR